MSYWPCDTSLEVEEITVGALLRRTAERCPEAEALVAHIADDVWRRWTYAELVEDAEGVAHALLRRFSPGDRIAVWSPNRFTWLLLEFGAALAGMTLVTVNPAFQYREVAYVVGKSRAQGLIYADSHRGTDMRAVAERVDNELDELRHAFPISMFEDLSSEPCPTRALPEVDPRAVAQIQYTSGTTGFPKGAQLTHRGLTNNARFDFLRLGFPEGGRWMNFMPMFHTGGCATAVMGPLWLRGTLVLPGPFEAASTLRTMEDERVSGFGCVPTMLMAMMEQSTFPERDLSSLEVIVTGGSPVAPEFIKNVESTFGAQVTVGFGQTELSPVVTQTEPNDSVTDKTNTVGRPLAQVECKLIDHVTGHMVPIGSVGEFCARGYQAMVGYFEQDEDTAAAIDADGWVHTGDLCTMDERGYFTVVGRLKDMIIRGGENVYPAEIEAFLFTHPDLAEVAVVGVPDDYWGEQVAAVLRFESDTLSPTREGLVEFCNTGLARHKRPRHWYITEQMPTTGSGKIEKNRLKEQIATGALRQLD